VPATFISHASELQDLADELRGAARVAIDTETPISANFDGLMRVMSVATRRPDGTERSFVVDVRDVHAPLLAPLLDGITADAWNANFDARVVDRAVFESDRTTASLRWWDAQIADALIHQGRSGFNFFHGLAWATDHYLGIIAEGKGTVQLSYTADDNLTADQIAYAAADAVETLWVGDAIRTEIAAAGLEHICEIEMRARPFLDEMERCGLPFDWPGWQAELDRFEARQREVIGEIALMTGGGQGSLFDDVVEPSWNPSSDSQLRRALNQWSEPEVLAWAEKYRGGARHLVESDPMPARVLEDIGGRLCTAMLEYRNHAKILSTYGESIHEHLADDGRLHPQYLQVVGTNTGRLASRNPNAQNFTPLMKPFVRPADSDRLFVHADLSQAELRYLAQVSNDGPLRAAFAGGVDVHVSTAATMFRFDAEKLRVEDKARHDELRQIAKALNFGIAYGQGAAALAGSLTRNGTPTTAEEGRQLLTQYQRTYPGTTQWAADRDAEIRKLADSVGQIDWKQSMRLVRHYAPIAAISREFRAANRRRPSRHELTERYADLREWSIDKPADELALEDTAALVDWVWQYSAPVALLADGTPFTFASHTLAGRRQQFNLHLDRVMLEAAVAAVSSRVSDAIRVRSTFEQDHNVVLHGRGTGDGRRFSEEEIAWVFEDRPLRRKYMEAVALTMGAETAREFLRTAASDRISAMVNAWRNAPIQGGVADIMLAAYGDLHKRLRSIPGAVPVQTVHDSVVIECPGGVANQVAYEVKEALESAMLAFCPDVTPKADVDIRASLSDGTVIEVLD